MAKLWSLAFALLIGAGVWAAPVAAQSNDVDDVGNIQRGGGEVSSTELGESGLGFKTDGFELNMSTRIQFRFTHQQETANGEDGTNGRNFNNFRVRRARTTFKGHIVEREFTYLLQLDWVNTGGGMVQEAWFRWAANPYANVSAGQHKLPWNWEEVSSSGKTQFVDRSYVNEVFNQGYAKGVWIDGQVGDDTPWLKYWFGIYNGVLAGNSDFRNADRAVTADSFSNLVDTEMMINLRLETHPMGQVEGGMFDMRGEESHDQILFAVGLGVNWMMSGYNAGTAFATSGSRADTAAGTPASGRFRTNQDTLAITLDGHFRYMGLSVDVAFFWRHTEFHNRGANDFDPSGKAGIGDMEDIGLTFEAAYFIIPEKFNVGFRFNMLNADDFWSAGIDNKLFGVRPDTTEIGVSANYFIHGNNLKLTMDIVYVSQQVPVAAGTTLLGVYNTPPSRVFGGGTPGSSAADYNDLWLIRLQLQWIF